MKGNRFCHGAGAVSEGEGNTTPDFFEAYMFSKMKECFSSGWEMVRPLRSHLATEAVADAADGFDEGAVFPDFLSQHVDVLVDGARVREVFHAPAAV